MRPTPLPATAPPSARVGSGGRLASLDAFRGATIVGMILVNNPGTWGAVYGPLLHAPWHGWTPTDLVFPFFLFIVGTAIVFAYRSRVARGEPRAPLVRKAAVRALWLFGLGLMLAWFPFVEVAGGEVSVRSWERLRILGVLQRIALCYFAAVLFYLFASARVRAWSVGLGLVAYWLALVLIPVPGYGAGLLDTPHATLSAWFDRLVLTPDHLWAGADRLWDPEGLLSTLPAIGTTLLGCWAGDVLTADADRRDKALRLFVGGVVLLAVGYCWSWVLPLNKSLWTPSYAVFTAGQAAIGLGAFYVAMDLWGRSGWGYPFQVYGVNAITVFVMSGVVAKTLIMIRVPWEDGATSLQAAVFRTVFEWIPGPPEVASLVYALVWITLWYLVLRAMYGRGLVIKV
jgi:predicted acyltransferase